MIRFKLNWKTIIQGVVGTLMVLIITFLLGSANRINTHVSANTQYRKQEAPKIMESIKAVDSKVKVLDNKMDAMQIDQATQKQAIKGLDEKLDILLQFEREK